MQSITITCPGKTILTGEHAVVYNEPALVAANSFSITTTISLQPQDQITLLWEGETQHTYSIDQCLQQAHKGRKYYQHFQQTADTAQLKTLTTSKEDVCLLALGETLLELGYSNQHPKGFALHCSTTIPLGKGCGSSAALAACISGATLTLLTGTLNKKLVEQLTHTIEQRMHGTPSGVDGATIIHGGMLLFQKGHPIQHLPEYHMPQDITLWYVDAGMPQETTGELVQHVQQHYQASPDEYSLIFQTIGRQTKNIQNAISARDSTTFLLALKKNQHLLEQLGIVAPDITQFCREVEIQGGVAKISGAGGKTSQGGGSILCFGIEQHHLKKITEKYSFSNPQELTLGTEGIRIA